MDLFIMVFGVSKTTRWYIEESGYQDLERRGTLLLENGDLRFLNEPGDSLRVNPDSKEAAEL